MGDVLDPHSSRMNIDTLSALQTVRYGLISSGLSACEYFKRADIAYDPVDPKMSSNFRFAAQRHKEKHRRACLAREEKKKTLAIAQKQVLSKKRFRELSMLAVKRAMKDHRRSTTHSLAKRPKKSH
jgi:hypothetical protein